jgi:hypothetical protein
MEVMLVWIEGAEQGLSDEPTIKGIGEGMSEIW